jgi:DNA topoisomerase I
LWREFRDEMKYHRMSEFGEALPNIRARVDRDLSRHGFPRERVRATIVRLLDETAIRIGNPEYARKNNSYGLATLRSEHVDVRGQTLRLHFRAKGGKFMQLAIKDRRVASIIRRLEDLPGQEVFHYLTEDGKLRVVESTDVNEYLRQISSHSFTAKNFRTWSASVIAAESLVTLGPPSSATAAKRNINEAIDIAASHLGNTRAVCRKSYIHPDIVQGDLDGWLEDVWTQGCEDDPPGGIHPEETAMLAVLDYADTSRRERPAKAG